MFQYNRSEGWRYIKLEFDSYERQILTFKGIILSIFSSFLTIILEKKYFFQLNF